MQAAPEFLESTVSSAVPVFRLRMIEEDLRLCKASSNKCAVLESKILLLRLRVSDYIQKCGKIGLAHREKSLKQLTSLNLPLATSSLNFLTIVLISSRVK